MMLLSFSTLILLSLRFKGKKRKLSSAMKHLKKTASHDVLIKVHAILVITSSHLVQCCCVPQCMVPWRIVDCQISVFHPLLWDTFHS